MENFELPTNVKQIGSIEKGLRIYVEDYVFTFIQTFTRAGGNNEKLAILVGRPMTIDSLPILFISGAIEGRFCIEERGAIEFSEKSNEYILDVLDRYFPSLEVVGWVQSQPGYGTYLSSRYYNYHMQNFKKEYQVLFITDPIQKINTFYMYNENNELSESKGYFVYYDKNKSMHEYMIECKTETSDIEEKGSPLVSFWDQKSEDEDDDDDDDEDDEKEDVTSKKTTKALKNLRTVTPRNFKKRGSSKERTTSTKIDHKKLLNMLAGLCAVMFLVSFAMGAGLLRSEDRIDILERNLSALNTAYRDLTLSLEPNSPSFAQNNQSIGVALSEDGNRLLEEENARAALAQIQAENQQESSVVTVSTNTNTPETYTVEQGDSLIGISRKVYGNADMVDKIMEANKITDPDKIFFGQILILPKP